MKKILILLLSFLLVIGITGCGASTDSNANTDINTNTNQENQNQNDYNESVLSEETNASEEIILNKDNISEYLKIDFTVEDISVSLNTGFNPPMDEGTGKIVVKTTALKRGDFEDVNIVLMFESDRGWDPTTVRITLPFDGKVTETKELLSFRSLLFDNPRYEMTISSVSGKFVK